MQFLILLAIVALQRGAQAEVHRYSFFEAPGVFSRCDFKKECIPYADRAQFSLDFLCCEDILFVSTHVFNPAFIYIISGNIYFALLAPFWWEAMEASLLLLFKNFLFTTSNDWDFETVVGAVIGDAFINGSLGVIIGLVITTFTGMVSPFSRFWYMANGWIRLKYVALFLLFEGGLFLVSKGGEDALWGAFLTVGYEIIALLVVFRYATNNESDVRLVWGGRRGVLARDWTFVIYLIAMVLLVLSNCGLHYLANDWYQVWLTAGMIIFIMMLAIKVKPVTPPIVFPTTLINGRMHARVRLKTGKFIFKPLKFD
jgi:hypothetical protein